MSKESQIHIRVTEEEKEKIRMNAEKLGFRQVSEYLRVIGLVEPSCSLSPDFSGINVGLQTKISRGQSSDLGDEK